MAADRYARAREAPRLQPLLQLGVRAHPLALLDKYAKVFGEDRVRELFPDNRSDQPSILPGREATTGGDSALPSESLGGSEDAEQILASLGTIRSLFHSIILPASNSWVVDGTMTASGKPILANDPHLMPQIPSIWYENRLLDRATGRWVAGASLPGIPGVMIGRNDRVAWGLTTSFADVQDLFLEMVDDYVNPRRYLEAGQMTDLEVVEERIQVRGGDDVIEKVYRTKRGPLLSRWLTRKGDP